MVTLGPTQITDTEHADEGVDLDVFLGFNDSRLFTISIKDRTPISEIKTQLCRSPFVEQLQQPHYVTPGMVNIMLERNRDGVDDCDALPLSDGDLLRVAPLPVDAEKEQPSPPIFEVHAETDFLRVTIQARLPSAQELQEGLKNFVYDFLYGDEGADLSGTAGGGNQLSGVNHARSLIEHIEALKRGEHPSSVGVFEDLRRGREELGRIEGLDVCGEGEHVPPYVGTELVGRVHYLKKKKGARLGKGGAGICQRVEKSTI